LHAHPVVFAGLGDAAQPLVIGDVVNEVNISPLPRAPSRTERPEGRHATTKFIVSSQETVPAVRLFEAALYWTA
jgi:hypothetical protein